MFDIKKIVFYKKINETLFLLLIFINIFLLLRILINFENLKENIIFNLESIYKSFIFLVGGGM